MQFGKGNPTFWAGTNNRAYINCYSLPNSPNTIEPTIAEISILVDCAWTDENNLVHNEPQEEIYHWVTGNRQPLSLSATCNIMFDSTKYRNDSMVTITLRIKEASGNVDYRQVTSKIRNWVSIFENPDFYSNPSYRTFDNVKSAFESAGYEVMFSGPGTEYTAHDVCNAIVASNFFYSSAHGDYLFTGTERWHSFEAGDGSKVFAHDGASENVLNSTISGVGSQSIQDYPPFNLGRPSSSIVFLNSCSSLQEQDLSDAFLWPYTNWYIAPSSYCENQATIGWTGPCYGFAFSASAGNDVMWYLQSGRTVAESIGIYASSTYGDLTYSGDPNTRLTTVYTGSVSSAPSGWYRFITEVK